MTNSVDPDQTLYSTAYDLGLHSLFMPTCLSILENHAKANYIHQAQKEKLNYHIRHDPIRLTRL